MADEPKKYGSNKPSQKLEEGATKKGGVSAQPSSSKPTAVPAAQNPQPAKPSTASPPITGQNPSSGK